MSDFLGQMASASRVRCEQAKRQLAADDLRLRALARPAPPPLRLDGRFDLIAEVKRRAPSAGVLAGPDQGGPAFAVDQARRYAAAGAAAISVLTEPSRFDGHLDDLRAVALAVDVPVMRKDFLVDPYQVWEARDAGAGGVLLIVRMLDDVTLLASAQAAAEAGLFLLVEAFDADDLARADRLVAARPEGAPPWLVGVNQRDLVRLDVDPHRLERLAHALPAGIPAVAESGLSGPADAARVCALGYQLALVGSALMAHSDPGGLAAAIVAAGRAAAGPA